MRWPTERNRDRTGETRDEKPFAWLPKRMDDGTTVWLERYWRRRQLARLTDYEYGGTRIGWATERALPWFKRPSAPLSEDQR